MNHYTTRWREREKNGIPLTIDDFILKPTPCGNPRLHVPFPEVPEHLMEPSKATIAKTALENGQTISGTFGENESTFDTPEFQLASNNFGNATGGLSLEGLLREARDRCMERRSLI